MSMLIEEVEMFGWQNCFRINSENIELVTTADVGPRIIHFSEKGGPNLLKIFENEAGRVGDKKFLFYGGHRIWAAPEDPVLSYIPDNDPAKVIINDEDQSIVFIRANDGTGLRKSIELRIADKGGFFIRNEIFNIGSESARTASWGITSFAPGGVGIFPLIRKTKKELQLRSDFSLNLWHYTDFTDPAFEWHKNAILFNQKKCLAPQKIGCYLENPTLGYMLGEYLITKQMIGLSESDDDYPDRGSNAEIYLNPEMLELEFLSKWKTLKPGESVFHQEYLNVTKIDDKHDINSVIDMVLGLNSLN